MGIGKSLKKRLEKQRKRLGEKQASMPEHYRKIEKKRRKEREKEKEKALKTLEAEIEEKAFKKEQLRIATRRARARGREKARVGSRGRFAGVRSTLGKIGDIGGTIGETMLFGTPEPKKAKPKRSKQPQRIVVEIRGNKATRRTRAKKKSRSTRKKRRKKEKDPFEELLGL